MSTPDLTQLFTDIAGAIREADGSTGQIPAASFPGRIRKACGLPSFQSVTLPAEGFSCVTYGGEKFVAMCASEPKFAASTDGMSWTLGTVSGAAGGFSCVAYGGGRFVALAKGLSADGFTSTDGVTWTKTAMPSSKRWTSAVYGGGKFIATHEKGGACSTDGVTWTANSLTQDSICGWLHTAYAGGRYMAAAGVPAERITATVPYCLDRFAYSGDGSTWEQASFPASLTNPAMGGIACGNGLAVAAVRGTYKESSSGGGGGGGGGGVPGGAGGGGSREFTSGSALIAYSEDGGMSWKTAAMPFSAEWDGVAFGNGLFVAVTKDGDRCAFSRDGKSWQASPMPSGGTSRCAMAFGNGRFVAVNSAGSLAEVW